MDRLASKSGRIAAFRAGAGPDLVILHSLLTDYAAFARVLPELAASHRVTLINLPGFHGSAAVAATPPAHVGWLGEACEAFGVRTDATLLGNGFGGTLAHHVLYGEFDQATAAPAINHTIAERIPGATITMPAGCGHCPPLDAPTAFLAAVAGMLR